ncbi:hypothetical protein GCM10010336_37640 [Streptomyces goshikiensis]|nr:hypothetical protein GCM10010336_37640 [Streptomyces goshikiensis]
MLHTYGCPGVGSAVGGGAIVLCDMGCFGAGAGWALARGGEEAAGRLAILDDSGGPRPANRQVEAVGEARAAWAASSSAGPGPARRGRPSVPPARGSAGGSRRTVALARAPSL